MANSNIILASKKALRKKMSDILRDIPVEEIRRQSDIVTKKVIESPEWIEAKRVSVYLSMPTEELQTDAITLASLAAGKHCFVPLCTKDHMSMLRVKDDVDLMALPRNSWGIREPKPVEGREDALQTGGLDLVICPGVAFTKEGHRLGHGKGYYDKFLKELSIYHQNAGTKQPNIIAIALKEQILDEVPINDEDVPIKTIITST